MVLNKILPLEQDICVEMAYVRYDLFNSEQLSSGSLTHPLGSTASKYYYKRPQLCSQKELPYYLVKTKWFPLCTHTGQFLDQNIWFYHWRNPGQLTETCAKFITCFED